jgi:hypothetical protein
MPHLVLIFASTHDGRKIRMLNIVDGYTSEALTIRRHAGRIPPMFIDVLSDLFILLAYRRISGRTTAPSSLPRRCRARSKRPAPRLV